MPDPPPPPDRPSSPPPIHLSREQARVSEEMSRDFAAAGLPRRLAMFLTAAGHSAAAYAKSISMVSASIIKEGYTFMFVCLVAVALIVQLRITRLTTNRASRIMCSNH